MALQLSVETLDDVPEAARPLYVEQEGKFILPVEGIEDTKGLKTALEAERKAAKEAAKIAKQFEGLGLSPDEIKALAAERKAAEEKRHRDEGNFNSILEQKQQEWQKQLEVERQAREAAEKSEHKAVIGTSLMSALTKLGATDAGVDLLPDRLAARIRYEMEDGQRVIRILSADGGTPMAGSAKDGTATFDDLVKEAMNKWPSLFNQSGAGAGGKPASSAGGAGGKTMARAQFEALSPHERMSFVKGGGSLV